GPTDLENCAPLCRVHHDIKTYLGFRRVRDEDGEWILVPPDDYLDPEQPDPTIGPTLFFNPWTGEPSDAALRHGAADRSGLPGGCGAAPSPTVARSPRRSEQPALAGMSGPAP
ncbi:MAG: hypothetical protein QOE80_4158, partial [Actinomycetota bacterium]|nr:hypothetical protein [Actinomycetota bacterium]